MPNINVRVQKEMQKDLEEVTKYLEERSSEYIEVNTSTVTRKAIQNLINDVKDEKKGFKKYPMLIEYSKEESLLLRDKLKEIILSLDDYKEGESFLSAHLGMIYQDLCLRIRCKED